MTLSSTYEFSSGPNTPDGEMVGRSSDAKVGFFGTVPVARPTVPATAATVQQVVDALAALGLVLKV